VNSYLADTDVHLRVPLRVNGEPVVPDTGSVKFSLRDNTGQVLIASEAVVMATASSEASITVDASHHHLTTQFSHRVLEIEFTKSGRPLRVRQTYRIIPWLNLNVTEDDVRNFIGTDRGELPDDAISMTDGYFDVENDLTTPVLEAALASGTRAQTLANRMVVAKVVLNLMPSLPLRLAQSESNGVFSATRAKIDFDKLAAAAAAQYAEGLDVLQTVIAADQDLIIAPALSPDPLTGA
jgi:hypothetical protein